MIARHDHIVHTDVFDLFRSLVFLETMRRDCGRLNIYHYGICGLSQQQPYKVRFLDVSHMKSILAGSAAHKSNSEQYLINSHHCLTLCKRDCLMGYVILFAELVQVTSAYKSLSQERVDVAGLDAQTQTKLLEFDQSMWHSSRIVRPLSPFNRKLISSHITVVGGNSG